MYYLKKVFILTGFFLASIAALHSQGRELTVEDSYLQQSIELMIIREQSRAESRDMKLVALEYIGDAINRGNTGPEIRESLEYLGIEGIINQTRENGRLINNYPDIRVRAAAYLGSLGTPEAKDSLMKMLLADNEPMVLTEIIKSLGNIGLNEGYETTDAISHVIRRFDALNPDNLLALSAIEAFEKLAAGYGSIDQNSLQTLMLIADGRYLGVIRERARQSLLDLRVLNARSRAQ